jgi:hypothetical protein
MTVIQGGIETFTGLLVLVGFLQVLVLFMQWMLFRRQNKHFRVSERAWILADLGWYPKGLHVVTGTTQRGGLTESVTEDYTDVNVKLTCRNEGRSPAWIDEVYGHVERIAKGRDSRIPKWKELSALGSMEPIGAGKEHSRVLQMQCRERRKESEVLSVYVIVQYHDIFQIKRETFLGYIVDSDEEIYRQLGFPERNRNT